MNNKSIKNRNTLTYSLVNKTLMVGVKRLKNNNIFNVWNKTMISLGN